MPKSNEHSPSERTFRRERAVTEKYGPQSLVREVLVIDNNPLRQKHFAEARKIIEKIERLEDKISVFHSSDQKRYDEWYALNFRKDLEKQEAARNEYQELARFHNWIVATAHRFNIEMPEAYIKMKLEQIRWKNGTEEEKRLIDEERERREAYIRNEFRSRYNENYDSDEDDDDVNGGVEGLEQILTRLENQILHSEADQELPAEDRIARLLALSDEKLVMAMDDQEVAFMMFDISLNWGQTHRDYSLFKRLWRLMSESQRKFFSYVYHSVTDQSIEGFLHELGLDNNASSDFEDDEDKEDENEAFQFDDQYIGEKRSRAELKSVKVQVVNEERIKQTFRKLMRKLHPDVHASLNDAETTAPWVQRIWGMVQNAYNSKNLVSLERLLKLTLIRMNILDELSVGEISEAKHWLRQDLMNLENESSEFKNSPAWGFSQKKNFTSLSQRIQRRLNQELADIQEQISELADQHELFEALSERPCRSQKRPRRARTSGRRRY